jgi:hypothetical protein
LTLANNQQIRQGLEPVGLRQLQESLEQIAASFASHELGRKKNDRPIGTELKCGAQLLALAGCSRTSPLKELIVDRVIEGKQWKPFTETLFPVLFSLLFWGTVKWTKELLEPDMSLTVNTLSEKIQTLSAEQISEVEDFVEFLRVRRQERELTRAAAAASAPAFAAVWNNPEDDAYDAL